MTNPSSRTNPLDYPRYVRSIRPANPDSLALWVEDELEKVQNSTDNLAVAADANAAAKVSAEATARDTAISGAVTPVVNALAQEVTDRANAIITNSAAIAAEASARASAVAAEATARNAALVAEATARANAILAEATARGTAITTEQTARIDGDNALAELIVEITAGGGSSSAAILAEQTARIAADSAEATSRETLAAQVRGSYTGTDTTAVTEGLLYSERTARATADSALSSSISTLAATVATNASSAASAVTTEAAARATADTAEATSRQTLSTKVTGFADPSGVIGLGDLTSGLIYDEKTARNSADSAEVTARQLLSTKVLGTNDPSSVSSVAALSSGFIFDEKTLRTTADTSLANSITALGVTVSNGDYENAVSISSEESARVNADMALGTRVDNVIAQATTDRTASAAAITTEQTARTSADAAEASQRLALAVTVANGDASNAAAILSEQTARINGDLAEASARTSLGVAVTGLVNAKLGGANLVRNSSFERTTGIDVPGFGPYNNGVAFESMTFESVASTGRDGANALHTAWTVNTTTKGFYFETPNRGIFKPNSTYVLSFYARAVGGAVGCLPHFAQNTPPTGLSYTVRPALTTEWQRYAITLTWGSAADVNGFIHVPGSTGASEVYYDQVQITEGDALTGYAPSPYDAQDDIATTAAQITSESTVRADADTALGYRIDTVVAQANTDRSSATGAVTSEATARASADTALGSRIDTVTAQATTDRANASSAVASESTARAGADTALGSRIDTVVAQATTDRGTASAAVSSEATARIAGDSAVASSVTSLSTTVGTNTASISSLTSSVNGLNLRYGVTLDSNGYVSGFSQNNSGSTSDFTILADNFKVVQPGNTPTTVFEVSGGVTRIKRLAIGTGNVDTAQIAGNATSNIVASVGGTVTPGTGFGTNTNLLTLAVTCTGGPIKIDFGILFYTSDGGSTVKSPDIRVVHVESGTTVSARVNQVAWGTRSIGNYSYCIHSPGAGTATYRLVFFNDGFNYTVTNSSLALTEFKR